MADGKAAVGTRVEEAKRAARKSEVEFRALSKARLTSLKTLPPARLARLGRDPELTEADQKDLQNFIANRTKAVERRGNPLSKILSWRFGRRRSFGFANTVLALNGVLLAIASVAGWMATPSEYQVLGQTSEIAIGDQAGPRERVILPAGTVVQYEGNSTSDRAQPVRLWVDGSGYRSTIYYTDQ